MEQIQKVPFLDLDSQIEPLRSKLLVAIEESFEASDFILGPRLSAFESAFADYCESGDAVGVASGSDALYLALLARDIGPGDEVITVPNTFVATVEAIVRTGAKAILVDVDEETFCMDVDAARKAVNDRTKAIIPVHLYGQPCDMDPLMDLAADKGIFILEDACQAHGALYKGKKVGSLGHAAAFSFYPTKNLGGFGDGGAVTTSDGKLAERIRALRHHAQSAKNLHSEIGYNSRLDSVQATVLNVRLPYLDAANARRQELAARFKDALKGTEYMFQKSIPETTNVYHILAARHPQRHRVLEQLDQSGIGWGKHIVKPIHLQTGYRFLGYGEGSLPRSEMLSEEVISLPIFPTLDDSQVDHVINTLAKVATKVR